MTPPLFRHLVCRSLVRFASVLSLNVSTCESTGAPCLCVRVAMPLPTPLPDPVSGSDKCVHLSRATRRQRLLKPARHVNVTVAAAATLLLSTLGTVVAYGEYAICPSGWLLYYDASGIETVDSCITMQPDTKNFWDASAICGCVASRRSCGEGGFHLAAGWRVPHRARRVAVAAALPRSPQCPHVAC